MPFREGLGTVPTQPGGGRAKARPYSHDPLPFREELGNVPTQIGGGRAKARPYCDCVTVRHHSYLHQETLCS
ncbi:MAG: hypothetical protein J5980_02960 [Muribaculaceae bacterium]|nr:hypothetical protein [Muribaculaceae bacterium]